MITAMAIVNWTTGIAAWVVVLWASLQGIRYRAGIRETEQDRAIAAWARTTMLTVVTASGSVFTTTLADLHASDVPGRSWNVPLQTTVSSTLDDEGCTGPHTHQRSGPVSWCRESCTECMGDDAVPCYVNHRAKTRG